MIPPKKHRLVGKNQSGRLLRNGQMLGARKIQGRRVVKPTRGSEFFRSNDSDGRLSATCEARKDRASQNIYGAGYAAEPPNIRLSGANQMPDRNQE